MKENIFCKKNIASALMLLLAVLMLTGPTPALADDDDDGLGAVTETIGPFSGLTDSQLLDSSTKEDIPITSNMKYNYQTDLFIYPVSDSSFAVTANVADGMVTTKEVSINVPNGVVSSLYFNGSDVSQTDMQHLSTPGRYVFKVRMGGTVSTLFSFQILSEMSGELNRFTLPEGFEFGTVLVDGEEVMPDGSFMSMMEEGEYDISYRCRVTNLPYSLHVIVDKTPPALKLENVENGRARGPVDISDMEEGAMVYMTYDGEEINYAPLLTISGTYDIIITDKSGNVAEYSFRILPYLDSKSWIAIATFVAAIAAITIYLLLEKKRLKVR